MTDITAALDALQKSRASAESVDQPKPEKAVERENQPNEAAADETPEIEMSDDAALGSDPEAVEEDGDAGSEDEPGDDAALDREVPVIIDGKTEKMKLADVIAGYQRAAVTTQKQQKLAEERRGFESERQQVQQEREVYASLLGRLEEQLSAYQPKPPPDELYHTDPMQWVRQRELYRDHVEQQGAIQAERTRLSQVERLERKAETDRHIASEKERLMLAMPAWRDTKRFDEAKASILEYGPKLGFAVEELAAATDHRAILALWKARQYDMLMARKPSKEAAPSNPAPSLKPGASPARDAPRKTRADEAQQRLRKTGSVDDALAVLRGRRT